MAKKIVGLDNLKVVKNYIDKVKGDVSNELDIATKEYLDNQLEKTSEAIAADYNNKYKNLTDRIAYVEQYGNKEELQKLQLELDALVNNTNDKFTALDSLETDLKKLNGEYDNLNVKYNSIFSPGQLDEVIRTALISETVITDDMVSTPNMFATKMVALIANMGHINAGSIDAGTIKGSSIESGNTIVENGVNTNDPVWKIGNEGEGWLARKNIEWDTNGNVTFGPGVKISWNSITDVNDNVNKIFENYDSNIKNYINDFVITNTEGGASIKDLEDAKKAAEEAVNNLNTSLSGDLETAKQEFGEAVKSVREYAETEFAVTQQGYKDYADGVSEALKTAIAEGNDELAKELKALQKELDWEMEKAYENYQNVNTALTAINSDIKNINESALTKANMQELLSAAMINHTVVGEDYISAPSVLAKKIVGLVGTFGTINASQIVGTNIQGYTISSPTEVRNDNGDIVYEEVYEYELDDAGNPVQATDENGELLWEDEDKTVPKYVYATELNEDGERVIKRKKAELPADQIAWQLNSDGSGWLAEHAISWDYPRKENGEIDYPAGTDTEALKRYYRQNNVTVTFDDNVKIKWENVSDKPEGVSKFKATAFIRTNTDISDYTPTGGDYDNPKPTSKVDETKEWSDGIPGGDAILWATTCEFEWGATTATWSKPVKMTDTTDFSVMYSKLVGDPGNPDSNSDNWDDKATGDAVWMATRKCKNGIWEEWSVSKIKGEKGDEGEAKFKSIVFKKSTQPSVSAPSGGSYESPVPSGWEDGVPTDGEGAVWMSSCTFVKGDNSIPIWSAPKIMADSAEFDVEYSSLENPNAPSGHPNKTEGWTNEPNDPIWMATSNCKNGVWEEWVVSRVKGEKGEQGIQGPKGEQGIQGPKGEQGIQGPKGEDGKSRYFHIAYANDESGNGYNQSGGAYVSTYVDDVETDNQTKFNSAGWKPFKGAQGEKGDQGIPGQNGSNGETYYLHIAYATDANGNGFEHDWVDDANLKYIGQYTDTNPTSSNTPDDYAPWVKYIGDDGAKGDKGDKGDTGEKGANGKGISSVTTYYHASTTFDTYPPIEDIGNNPDKWNINPSTAGFNKQRPYLYTYTTTTYTDGSKFHSTPNLNGTCGKDGVDGKKGKTIYPAGKWDALVTYTSTENTTPYVVHDDEYWELVVDSSVGVEPGPSSKDWIKFDKFEAIFAKIGIIENGLFGSAVFNGHYMFSQYGKTTKGGNNPTFDYEKFNSNNPYGSGNEFYPNVCIDFYKGILWCDAGSTVFNENGININNVLNVYTDDTNTKRISLDWSGEYEDIDTSIHSKQDSSLTLSSGYKIGSIEQSSIYISPSETTGMTRELKLSGGYNEISIFMPDSYAPSLDLRYTFTPYIYKSEKMLKLNIYVPSNVSLNISNLYIQCGPNNIKASSSFYKSQKEKPMVYTLEFYVDKIDRRVIMTTVENEGYLLYKVS